MGNEVLERNFAVAILLVALLETAPSNSQGRVYGQE
jgi:hypothetical protein